MPDARHREMLASLARSAPERLDFADGDQLEALREPVHVSVVLAVYKEDLRIRRREEHPLGEDFLRRKLAQLHWLFDPLPQLRGIVDTQCGFKAFRAEVLRRWIEDTFENRFAFDIEFLLRVWLDSPDSIVRLPIAWIDSEAASTTAELQPYLSMLRSAAEIYRRYLPADPRSERYAALIESCDEAGWQRLLERVPSEIASREPAEFDLWAEVDASELEAIRDG